MSRERDALRALRRTWACGQEATYVFRRPQGPSIVLRVVLRGLRQDLAQFEVLSREDDLDVHHVLDVPLPPERGFPEHQEAKVLRAPSRGGGDPSTHLVLVQNLLNDALRAHEGAEPTPVEAPKNRIGVKQAFPAVKDLSSILASEQTFFATPHVPLLGLLRGQTVSAAPPPGSQLQVLDEAGRPRPVVPGEPLSSLELVAFNRADGPAGRDLLPDFGGARPLDHDGVAVTLPRSWIPRCHAIELPPFRPLFAPFFLFQVAAPSCALSWSLGVYRGAPGEVEERLDAVTQLLHEGPGEVVERRMLDDPDGLELRRRGRGERGDTHVVAAVRTRRDRRVLADLRLTLEIDPEHPRREAYARAVAEVAERAVESMRFT